MFDKKVENFLKKHHILTLSVCCENEIWSATCFYAFDVNRISLLIACDKNTKHMQMALKNPNVSVCIALETKIIGKIQGLQINGKISETQNKDCYFKTFPYTKILNPTIFEIKINFLEFTDNNLGFGKKIIWERS